MNSLSLSLRQIEVILLYGAGEPEGLQPSTINAARIFKRKHQRQPTAPNSLPPSRSADGNVV